MSDQNYGDPVDENVPAEETVSADEAVASAHEGLADAEAATRDVVEADAAEPAHHDHAEHEAVEHVEHEHVEPVETVVAPVTPAEPVHGSSWANDPVDEAYVPGAYSTPHTDDEPTVVAPVVPPVAPVAPAAPQPIFVQAPEAPRPRGNRGAAGAIGLLAAIAFGILYLGAALGLGALTGDVTVANVGEKALAALTSWWLWVPVAVFFLAFWLLGAIINRGRWGLWVHFGLLVGAAAYGGHILGQLFQAPFWTLTASQGRDLAAGQLLAPLAIVAFVLGRELTIWFSAWVAARGARMTELNREAQREYERTLEAGPRLQQG